MAGLWVLAPGLSRAGEAAAADPGVVRAAALPPIDQHLIGTLLLHQAGGLVLADQAIPWLQDPRLRHLATLIRERQRQDQALLSRWYGHWFGREVPTWSPLALNVPGLVLDPQAVVSAVDHDRAYVRQVVPYLRFGQMLALQAQVHTASPQLLNLQQQLVLQRSTEIRQLEAWAEQRRETSLPEAGVQAVERSDQRP